MTHKHGRKKGHTKKRRRNVGGSTEDSKISNELWNEFGTQPSSGGVSLEAVLGGVGVLFAVLVSASILNGKGGSTKF